MDCEAGSGFLGTEPGTRTPLTIFHRFKNKKIIVKLTFRNEDAPEFKNRVRYMRESVKTLADLGKSDKDLVS